MHRPVDFLPPQEPSPNHTTRAPKGGASTEQDGEPSAFAHALAHLFNNQPAQALADADKAALNGHQGRTAQGLSAQGRFGQVAGGKTQAVQQGEHGKQRFQLGQLDNLSSRQSLFGSTHIGPTGHLADAALAQQANLRGTTDTSTHRSGTDDKSRLANSSLQRDPAQRAHNSSQAAHSKLDRGDQTLATQKAQSSALQSGARTQNSWLQQAKRAERHSAQTLRTTERTRNLGPNSSAQNATANSMVGRNSIDLISPAAQLFAQPGSNLGTLHWPNAESFNQQSLAQGGTGQGAQALGEAMLSQTATSGSADNSHSAFAALHVNQALQPLGSGAFTATLPSPAAQGEFNVPLQHPQWGKQLGQNILRIAQQHGTGTQTAQLRLDPPHLGPLHITLHINESQVSAQFFSPHAQVRHSVEQALPQLFEQFNQAGIELGQTHVGSEQQPTHGQGFFAHDGRQLNPSLARVTPTSVDHVAGPDINEAATTRTHSLGAQSLIDTYA